MVDIEIRDNMIRLGQFLKLANVVQGGGEAKIRIQSGEVRVNDQRETRRGRQLHDGDRVEIDGTVLMVCCAGSQ